MKFNLSEFALSHQSLVRFFISLFFILIVFSYLHLNEKEDPDYNFRQMVVTVYWPGATADQVEKQILQRLEQYLNGIPHLKSLYGYALPGEAQFFVEVEEGLKKQELDDSWYQVRKKVSDIKHFLPEEIVGPFFNDEFGDVYGTIYALVGNGFSYAQLKTYADDIRRELLRLPDVGKVSVLGDQPQKIYVVASDQKMSTLGIDPQVIIDTIRSQNALQPAGIIRTKNNEIIIRISGAFDSLDSIRNINIHASSGDFRLGDIAEVFRGYEDPPTFKIHYNGKEAVDLIINMKQGKDVMRLGKALDKTMSQIKKSLPAGIQIYQVSNQSEVVKHAVEGFMDSLFIAIAIVLLVSFFSLGFRSGLVVALSIPLVLAITFSSMYLNNNDLQRVSLGALIIAIGLLVDDAMITVEMMKRKLEEGFDLIRAATFAYTSTAFPMLTGTLITIAGFLPMGLAKSDTGVYTSSILSVIGISLIVSWIVAVIFTPYIGYKILKEHKEPTKVHEKPLYKNIRRSVQKCLDNNKLVILITFLAFVLALVGFLYVHQQFFPPSDRPELLVNLRLPEGSPFLATQREVNKLEQFMVSDKDIISYTTYIGGNSPRFYLPLVIEPNRTNFAQMVILTKGGKYRENEIKKLRKILDENLPLVSSEILRLENGPPIGSPIQIRVSGRSPEVLLNIAGQIENIVKKNPYTSGVYKDWGKSFKITLVVDNDKARALGVSGQDLAQDLNIILNGASITKYREGTELIDIEAKGEPFASYNIDNLKDLNIYSRTGRYISLDNLVHFQSGVEEHKIARRDGALTITVYANVEGAEPLEVARNIFKELSPIIASLPPGYEITNEGLIKISNSSILSILAVVPATTLLMALILMVELESFQLVLLVFLTAPLGLIGVTLALLAFNYPFGFVAIGGFIALMGMIMRNSVILIDQIEKNIASGLPAYDAIVKAAVDRFRPIMLTAMAAILAMIPLVTNVFWGSMAATIMGGLLVATVLTIFYLPALYAFWFKIKK